MKVFVTATQLFNQLLVEDILVSFSFIIQLLNINSIDQNIIPLHFAFSLKQQIILIFNQEKSKQKVIYDLFDKDFLTSLDLEQTFMVLASNWSSSQSYIIERIADKPADYLRFEKLYKHFQGKKHID